MVTLLEAALLGGFLFGGLVALGPLAALGARVVRAAAKGRPRAWVLGLFLAGLSIPPLLSLGERPLPEIHDEHSLLLQADTFAGGRLTNPVPKGWQHFETFHVLLQPTYASKYPPGEGLVLALGQVLAGDPWVGVWIRTALLAVTSYWMLLAWLPPRWARLSTVLLLATVAGSGWTQGFEGGAVAAVAGCLLLGSVRRLCARPRAREGFLGGLGVVLLALTRPWEGLVLVAGAAVALVVEARRMPSWRQRLLVRRAGAVAACAVALGGLWLGFYQWRVTGEIALMPYQLHDRTYASTPVFLWQSPRIVPASRHEVMARHFSSFETESYRQQRQIGGWSRQAVRKLARAWEFYLGSLMTVGLMGVPAVWSRRWVRWACVLVVLGLVSQLLIVPMRPRYLAPFLGALWVVVGSGLRWLYGWQPGGRPWGRALVGAVVVGCLATVPMRAFATEADRASWPHHRHALLRQLQAAAGPDLVFVRYGPAHTPHAEWVFNSAAPERQDVLWGRSLGPPEDCRLLELYPARAGWIVVVEEEMTPPSLRAFSREPCLSRGLSSER